MRGQTVPVNYGKALVLTPEQQRYNEKASEALSELSRTSLLIHQDHRAGLLTDEQLEFGRKKLRAEYVEKIDNLRAALGDREVTFVAG